jgi:GalNAc-alpha-(1->4)-GalNAc-alpha-(1->3)-diNAcBac-PP-undecaprenol alpha-1,4-N-acetyl-D-galactosaminyltransferase
MRLLFVARSIDNIAGGVERMITTIINALVERNHQIDLLTWDMNGAQSFYPIDPQVTWHQLNMGDPARKAKIMLMVRRARLVRDIVRNHRYQAIICFQDGPFMAIRLYTSGMSIPVIAAERNAPTRFEHTKAGTRRSQFTFNAFRFAYKIILQNESFRNLYPDYLQKRIEVIPNPVQSVIEHASPEQKNTKGRFRLLSVGRLSYQKNYQCLIEAFIKIAPRVPDWDLEIIGEGEDRQNLSTMIQDSGLQERILLPGTLNNLIKKYSGSHLFCLSSRWEGFPNALAEALSHGLPAVGFADCAGVNDLIEDGITGVLTKGNGSSEDLSVSLENMMKDHEARHQMGNAAPETMLTFAPDTVFSRWEKILDKALND